MFDGGVEVAFHIALGVHIKHVDEEAPLLIKDFVGHVSIPPAGFTPQDR
jgi:hypothetical protein